MALAFAGEAGSVVREVETGLDGDREVDMLAFAVEVFRFVGVFFWKWGLGRWGKLKF